MKNIKNIIFDLGGVLIEWDPNKFLKEIFKNIEVKELKEFGVIHKIRLELDKGLINNEEAISKIENDALKKEFQILLDNIENCLIPLDEGVKILNEIKEQKKYNLYILSNYHEKFYLNISKKYYEEIFSKFDGGVISYEIKYIKPEKKIYTSLLNKYNLDPRETIFIDDNKDNILMSNKLDIYGILCDNHENVKKELIKLNILK
jgi:HAD superfamily hydrolase (TIGR01509 family)